MRPALIGLVTLLITLAADAPSGHGQESFFNKRFCTMGGGDRGSGMPDCGYNTWEQCRASASGLGRYCTENPYWRPEGSGGQQRTTRRRTGQQ